MMIVVGQLLVDSHSHTASAGWQHEKYFELTVSTISLAELMRYRRKQNRWKRLEENIFRAVTRLKRV